MEKIPTAEEVLKRFNTHEHAKENDCNCRWRDIVAMREFAKLHVEAALKEASENYARGSLTPEKGLSIKKAILVAYPLSNIK